MTGVQRCSLPICGDSVGGGSSADDSGDSVADPAIGAAVGGAAGAQWGNTIVDAVDKGIGVVFPSFNTTKEAAVYKSPGGGLDAALAWKQ